MKNKNDSSKSIFRIFRNKKFLMVLSVFLSFALWIALSSTSEIDTTSIISDIPVTLELPDEAQKNNLQVFDGEGLTASVSVTGNKVTVGSLSKSDIVVTAQQTNTITAPGMYKLPLVARKAGVKTGYDIVSQVSPSFITVTVDRFKSVDMEIIDNMTYHVDENYYGTTILSNATVNISGAEAEVDRIARVEINGKIDGILTSSQTVEKSLVLLDSDGSEIKDSTVSLNINTIQATISVLPKREIPLNLTYINKPAGLKIEDSWLEISPSKILIAGSEETMKNLKTIDLGPVDFSTLQNKVNNMTLDISLPTDCRNLSNENTVNVSLDLSSLVKKSFEVTKFESQGLSSNYTLDVTTKSLTVTIIGTADQMSEIKADDLTAVVDFSNKKDVVVGSTDMDITIKTGNYKKCYAYGSYKANVIVSQNKQLV